MTNSPSIHSNAPGLADINTMVGDLAGGGHGGHSAVLQENVAVMQKVAKFCRDNGIRIDIPAAHRDGFTYGIGADAIEAFRYYWETAPMN